MTDPCIICVRNTESKVKPGIFPCLGCKQMFCTQHVAFHRQELANELDLVIGERNELQDVFDHREELIDVSMQLNLIAEWVKKTVEQVYHVADNVRQNVLHLAEERKTSVKDQFAELSKQLDTLRENENFYEKDIENLKEQCIHLKNCLHPVDINVIVTDASSFLAQAVTLRHTEEKSMETRQPVESLSFVETLVKHQKPFKRIKLPHAGLVHMGNSAALLRSGDNFTIIDLNTDSLYSICMENSRHLIFCWSTYLDSFFCADPNHDSKIVLLRIRGQNLEKTYEFNDTIKKISSMVCFADRLMLVCYGTVRNNVVEEWSVAAEAIVSRTTRPQTPVCRWRSPVLIHRWRSPLTCASDETIENISFDDKRISLLITCRPFSTKSRVEFRTRNMYVIGQLELSDYNPRFSSILYHVNDGWLLGDKKDLDSPWHFTLIDDNLNRREQKILSTYGIINIELVKDSSNKSMLAIYRENGCVDKLTHNRLQLLLDLYVI